MIRLRAELDAAEARVIALGVAAGSSGKGGRFDQWLDGEFNAGRLPSFEGLSPTAVVGGHEPSLRRPERAEAGRLTVEDCESWAKRLAPLVKAAAKPLGLDARPESLPWTDGGA